MGDREIETIRLDQFLKLTGAVPTGGHAKQAIQNGDVLVNGTVETRRRRQLKDGDRVDFAGETYIVEWTPDEDSPE